MAFDVQQQNYQALEQTEANVQQQELRNTLNQQVAEYEFQNTNKKTDIQSAFNSLFEAMDETDMDMRLLNGMHPNGKTSLQNVLTLIDQAKPLREFLLACPDPKTGKFPLDNRLGKRLSLIDNKCLGAKVKELENQTTKLENEGQKLDKTVSEENEKQAEENKKQEALAENINRTLSSQTTAKEKYNLQVASPSDLNITDKDTPETTKTKQAKQEQVAKKL